MYRCTWKPIHFHACVICWFQGAYYAALQLNRCSSFKKTVFEFPKNRLFHNSCSYNKPSFKLPFKKMAITSISRDTIFTQMPPPRQSGTTLGSRYIFKVSTTKWQIPNGLALPPNHPTTRNPPPRCSFSAMRAPLRATLGAPGDDRVSNRDLKNIGIRTICLRQLDCCF